MFYRFGFGSTCTLKVSLVTAAAMLAICLLILVETTNTAEAEDSLPENGKIAFSREQGDASDMYTFEIYTMNPNGSSARRLTNDTYLDSQPNWSPDGTNIAFSGGENSSVMVMGADGSDRRDVLADANIGGQGYPSSVTWSPDGTKLAFTYLPPRRDHSDIFTMDLDGSNPTNLTKTPKFSEGSPDFSPDGSRMCFTFDNSGISGPPASGIYVMNANGSDPTLLIKESNREMVPGPGSCDWSPDGKKIVFSGAFKELDDSRVYVINADGSGRTALTSNEGQDHAPAWSPDGTKITFTRATHRSALYMNDSDVYTMDADGSDVAQITKTPEVDELDPTWQPLLKPTSSKGRSETVHQPDTGGLSLLLVASALLISGGVMFYAGLKRRM